MKLEKEHRESSSTSDSVDVYLFAQGGLKGEYGALLSSKDRDLIARRITLDQSYHILQQKRAEERTRRNKKLALLCLGYSVAAAVLTPAINRFSKPRR